jgi:hypothetical protein
MASDSEWFQGHVVQDDCETIMPMPFWALILGALIVCLQGCATTKEGPRNEVCMFRLLGNTSDGMPVVATTCVSPEAFAESQK